MNNLQAAVLHAINALVIIAAAIVLAMTGHIDSATATALIAAAGGLSLGVGAVSIGASSSVPTAPASASSSAINAAPTLTAAQLAVLAANSIPYVTASTAS